MIATNELRLENIVFDKANRPFRIKELTDITYAAYYSPVPLSEEILLSAGFKKSKGDGYAFEYVFYKKDGITIGYKYDFYVGVIQYSREEFGGMLDFQETSKSIKSVHQLQNLYFALKGEELIIPIQGEKITYKTNMPTHDPKGFRFP